MKTTFFTTGGWNSAGTITVNEMIFFNSYWVLYKLHEREDWLSLIAVLRVSCPAVFCVVAATCEKPKSIPHVNGYTIHGAEFRFKQSQKLPWNIMHIGYSRWARKTRNSCHSWNNRSNTFLLDNQHASAWNITSLRLLSCLCILLKTFSASSNVRGWIS